MRIVRLIINPGARRLLPAVPLLYITHADSLVIPGDNALWQEPEHHDFAKSVYH